MLSFHPLSLLRFSVTYLLTLALIVLAIGAMGSLFLARDVDALLLLCEAGALISLVLAISRLSDWACWLIVQAAGIVAAIHFAGSSVTLVPSLTDLPAGPQSFSLPFHHITISIGNQSGSWTLLLLLGLLAWELTWGVLWLVLRAEYLWSGIVMAATAILAAANVESSAGRWFLPFSILALILVLWHTWSGRLVRAARQAEPLRPRLTAIGSLIGGLAALALAVPAALLGPLPASASFSRWANQMWAQMAPNLSDPLRLLNGQNGSALASEVFGSQLKLDGPFRPVSGVVMRVRGVPAGVQPYWRGVVYDSYQNDAWQVSASSRTLIVPSGDAIPGDVPGHPDRQLSVAVQVVQPENGLVFAPGRPLTSSLTVRAGYSLIGSGGEPSAVYASTRLPAGAVYDVTAELPPPAPDPGMGGPGADPYYTLLPAALDPRITALARDLTGNAPSAFAAATAIEAYLKNGTFTYDAETGAAPAGQNPVSYFLFDSHRGYCVHFASAMALLARAAGLPARVVGGYATGKLVNGVWQISGSDAHTWPEIFFAGTGWVPFEPTPGFDGESRAQPGPGPTLTTPAADPSPSPAHTPVATDTVAAAPPRKPTPSPPSAHHGPMALRLLGLLALAVTAGGAALHFRRQDTTIGGVYRRMCRTARWLAVRPRPAQTPNEFARVLGGRSAVESEDISRITALYVAARYGGRSPSAGEVRSAAEALRRLRRRWLARRLGLG